jgi:hypothetical protein
LAALLHAGFCGFPGIIDMTSRFLLAAMLLCAAAVARAQDAGSLDTVRSTLTRSEIESSLFRHGSSPSGAADAAGIPSPRRALELTDELTLNADQVARLAVLDSLLEEDVLRYGAAVVVQERRLDSVFATGDPRDWIVRPIVREIGRLQTELRYAVLHAHMRVRELLSEEQLRACREDIHRE